MAEAKSEKQLEKKYMYAMTKFLPVSRFRNRRQSYFVQLSRFAIAKKLAENFIGTGLS